MISENTSNNAFSYALIASEGSLAVEETIQRGEVMTADNTDVEELYASLVEEHSDTVTRLCLIHTGNYADAEDCYQNVFFKLYKQLKKESIPNPKAWIIKVTLNECKSILRYRLRSNTVELEKITRYTTDSREHEMLDIIFRLSPKYRDVIFLFYYEELTLEEIALATKSNLNTVKSRLKRGRDKLRDYLSDEEGGYSE